MLSTRSTTTDDARYLYISGNKQLPVRSDDGDLVDESEHLGLTVVDTTTWEPISSPELPVQFVRSVSGGALAVDTTSTQPWIDHYYLLSMNEEGAVAYHGPIVVDEGDCDLTPGHVGLLCSEFGDGETQVRTIDIETGDVIAERTIGAEDTIHANGILEDRPPRDGHRPPP